MRTEIPDLFYVVRIVEADASCLVAVDFDALPIRKETGQHMLYLDIPSDLKDAYIAERK